MQARSMASARSATSVKSSCSARVWMASETACAGFREWKQSHQWRYCARASAREGVRRCLESVVESTRIPSLRRHLTRASAVRGARAMADVLVVVLRFGR